MTICPKFEKIFLWDLRLNCVYELKGRIGEKDKHLLEKMLVSENQLIDQDTQGLNLENIIEQKKLKNFETNVRKEAKKDDFDFDKKNNKSDILGINLDDNNDEQDIIENQKVILMSRDSMTPQGKGKNKKQETYNFLKNKKREESRRLQESKGGYQIAVHDFYVKGQKGMNSKKYLFLDYFILLNLLIIYCFFKLKMKTNFKDFLKINSNTQYLLNIYKL